MYDLTRLLIAVWDFNVVPQMSVLMAQVNYDKKRIYILEEILGEPENNRLNDASKLRLPPPKKIPRKLAEDKQPITDWQLATFQTDYNPYNNPWMI